MHKNNVSYIQNNGICRIFEEYTFKNLLLLSTYYINKKILE